ncbi:hypothetical protein E2C01_072540 [Portunus trituberculatus]|uniref:Uncharacterized protein n=1 Tax=Portunus trituberculatus TaxID=210409 RepID=A0A5B7I842_PORTR|nr:hypothetical protein [Portunus trituberculatus]
MGVGFSCFPPPPSTQTLPPPSLHLMLPFLHHPPSCPSPPRAPAIHLSWPVSMTMPAAGFLCPAEGRREGLLKQQRPIAAPAHSFVSSSLAPSRKRIQGSEMRGDSPVRKATWPAGRTGSPQRSRQFSRAHAATYRRLHILAAGEGQPTRHRGLHRRRGCQRHGDNEGHAYSSASPSLGVVAAEPEHCILSLFIW